MNRMLLIALFLAACSPAQTTTGSTGTNLDTTLSADQTSALAALDATAYTGPMISLATMTRIFPAFTPAQIASQDAGYTMAVMNDAFARFGITSQPLIALFLGVSSVESAYYSTFCEFICGGEGSAMNAQCPDKCCASGTSCPVNSCGNNCSFDCAACGLNSCSYDASYAPYVGRGPLQVTFCSNYGEAQSALSRAGLPGWNSTIDFLEHPSQLTRLPWSLYSSAQFFQHNGEGNCINTSDPVGCATSINATGGPGSCGTGSCPAGGTCSGNEGPCFSCCRLSYYETALKDLQANPKQNAAPPGASHVTFNGTALPASTPYYIPCGGNTGTITLKWEELSPVAIHGVANVPQSHVVSQVSIYKNGILVPNSTVNNIVGTSYTYPASFTLGLGQYSIWVVTTWENYGSKYGYGFFSGALNVENLPHGC